MELRQSCPACGSRDKTTINAERVHETKPNGVGEVTFKAQGQSDQAKLEALFPRDDNDGHTLSYAWVSDYEVKLTRTRVSAKVLATPPGNPTVTQASLERLSKEDLETKAVELGIPNVSPAATKAQLAAMILEAMKKAA